RRHTRFSRDWSSDVCSSDLHEFRIFFISSILGYKLIIMSKETKTEETNENVNNLLDEVSSLNANVAPEEFDWESFEYGLNEADRKEKEELEKMYDDTLEALNE